MKNKKFYILACFVLFSTFSIAEAKADTCPMPEVKKNGVIFYHVVSNDNAGAKHDLYWKKESQENGKTFSNYIQGEKIENGVLVPQYKSVPVAKDWELWVLRNSGVPIQYLGLETKQVLDEEKTTPAMYACEKEKLHLPPKEAYEALINCVDQNVSEANSLSRPTTRLAQLTEKFPDMKDKWFWSSSVHPYYSNYAYVFSGYYGLIDVYYRDYFYYSVRCVAQR